STSKGRRFMIAELANVDQRRVVAPGNAVCACAFAVSMTLLTVVRAQGISAVHEIDLPTTLRLAGAQNLDVQIARERLTEAKANHQSAVAQFFPWVSPGITYRQHDNKIQDVQGNIIAVHKYSYAPGATVGVQLD